VAGSAYDTRLTSTAYDLSSAALYVQRSPYTTIQYDAFGAVSQTRQYANGVQNGNTPVADNALDRITQTRYDGRGRAVEERNLAAGTTIHRSYDAGDRLVEARTLLRGGADHQDPTSQVESDISTRFVYDKLGQQTGTETVRERFLVKNGARTAAGRFVDTAESIRYNAFGEIVAKDDRLDTAFAAGTPHAQFEYDNAGRMLRSNAQGGAWRDYGYDLAGRGVRMVQRSFVTNAQGVAQVVDAVSDSHVDLLGRITLQRLPANSDDVNQRPEVRRDYDRWGNVVRMVDARGHETLYRYNDQNKLTIEIRPEVKVVNRDGTELRARPTTAYYYDTYGRLVETRDANGNSDRYVYDNVGRVVQSIDALGKVTRTAYDVFDNDIYTQDPKGYIKAQLRGSTGQVSSIGDFIASSGASRNWTVLEAYDLKNSGDRWSTTIAPNNSTLNHTARYDYDIRHQLLGSRSAAGVVKTFDYDLQGRKTRETNGNVDRLRYLLRQHDVAGIITGDGTGRWVDVMDPYDGHYSHSEYVMDPYAGPRIRKDREGEYVFENEQTWDYDYFGRLIDHNDLGGADYDYIYHSVTGQLIRTTRATSVAMQVDPIQDSGIDTSLSTVDHVDGSATTEDGLPTTAGTNDRVQIYYASGLIKEIREGQNWTRYAYDVNGNRTMEETYTRDGGGNVVHLRTITTYDSNNRVSLVKQFEVYNDYAGVQRANEFVTVRYSYDAVGNRRRVTTGKSLSYQPAALVGYVGQLLTSYSYRDFVDKIAPETTFDISMTLADGSPLPSWLTWNPTTMMLQGTPPSAQNLTVRLTAVSSEDQSVTVADIPLQVMPSQPPRLVYDDGLDWNQTVDPILTEWTFASAAAFMDPEGMPLRYSAQLRVGLNLVALPAGMHIDPDTGVISGLPADGAYQIVVTATDVDQQSVSRTLSLSVASTPWTTTAFDNEFLEISMFGAFGTHSGEPPVGYAIQSVNGGAAPLWMSISDYGWGEWALTGTPSLRGIFNIVVRAIYADGSEAARTLVLTVVRAPYNDPGDPHLDPGEDLIGSDARLDSVEAPVLAATDLDSDASARLLLEDSMQLVAPIYDDGDTGSGGGGGGGGGGSTVPTTPGAGYISLPTNAWRSLWFDYDAENRVTIVNGRLVNGQILIGTNGPTEKDLSYAIQYDDAGRERLRTEMKSGVVKHQVLQYNQRGQLSLTYQFANSEAESQGAMVERRTYDDAGRLKYRQDLFHTPSDPTLHGQARLQDSYAYDGDGRVTAIHNSEGAKRIASFNFNTGAVTFEYYQNSVSATYYDYDESRDGLLVFNQYHHVKDSEYRLTYLYNYDARESYLEVSVAGFGTIGSGSFTPATTTSTYDHWGRRIKVHDSKDRLFAYDMSGGILQRIDNNSVYWKTRYAYANGQQVAATNSGWVDVASHLTAYQSGEQGSGTTSAMAGETLRSIALRVYGTESLWYVLASANGLDDNVDLTPGMTLRVPDVKVNSNDASTFKPYNPSEIIGNTTPQLDYVAPPPPPKNCGQIILLVVAVVVAVVVTVFTAGAMAAPSAAGIGAIMSAGTAVLTGTAVTAGLVASTGAMLAMAAAAGVAGALASQLVMVAGDKDYKFDWGAVALGGLTAAVGSGLGAAFSGASAAVKAADATKQTVSGLTKALDAIGKLSWARGAAQAVVGTVANYGANWALNRIDSSRDRANEKFSWTNLAASAVRGAVGGAMSAGDGKGMANWFKNIPVLNGGFAQDFIGDFVGSAVMYNVASLLGEEGRPDYGQMAIDAFGSALANATVRKITDIGSAHKKRVPIRNDKTEGNDEAPQGSESADEGIDGQSGTKRGRRMLHDQDRSHGPMGPSDDLLFDDADPVDELDAEAGLGGERDGGGKEKEKARIRQALAMYESNELGEADARAVKDILQQHGFYVSGGAADGAFLFNKQDFIAARLFLIDPALVNTVGDWTTWSPGRADYTRGEIISQVQAVLGVETDGVYGDITRKALGNYVNSLSLKDFVLQEVVVVGTRKRIDAGGVPAGAIAPADVPAVTGNPLKVSKGQITFDSEGRETPGKFGFSRVLHWPKGASGVTIGRGYDMKGRSQSGVYRDLVAAGVPDAHARIISRGAGLKGQEAADFVRKNKSIVISKEAQNNLFNMIYPAYENGAKNDYSNYARKHPGAPAWDSLDSKVRDIAVDLYYQQGDLYNRQLPSISANNREKLAKYITDTPQLSQYEKGRGRAKYLRK
jgi:YD repeat-containing protein